MENTLIRIVTISREFGSGGSDLAGRLGELLGWRVVDREVIHEVAARLGIGTGLGGPVPAAYAADIAPPEAVGPAMGLYRTLSDLGLVVGPVLLGWMVDVAGYGLAFWTNAALLVVTTVAFGLFARESAGRRARGAVMRGT